MLCFPLDFLDSWQFKKLVDLHGRRIALSGMATLLRLYRHASDHGPAEAIGEKLVMGMCDASDRRDKRRTLYALEQANLTRRVKGGYIVRAIQPLPSTLSRPQPTEQMALPLAPRLSGLQPTFLPACPAAAGDSVAAQFANPEQNQSVGLARAGAMSASQPQKSPPIDLASTHTEFSEATYDERSDVVTATAAQAGCLFGERSEAGIGMSAAQAGAACAFDFAFQKAVKRQLLRQPLGTAASRPKAVSGASAQNLGLGVSPVERVNDPLARIIEGRFPTRRVNARRVEKQQNVVNCREQSSAALAGEPQETRPPMFKPNAAEQPFFDAVDRSGLFRFGLRAEDMECWMKSRFTLDEVVEALADFQHRKEATGWQPKYPSLIGQRIHEKRARLADLAQAKRVARRGHVSNGKLELVGSPQKKPVKPRIEANDSSPFASTCAAINAYLGEERSTYHLINGKANEACIEALVGADIPAVVSLYTEMLDEVPNEERWPEVASAFADGRRAAVADAKPKVQSRDIPEGAMKLLASLNIWPPNVQPKPQKVDKLGRAS